MAFKLLLLKHYLEWKKIIYVISHDFSIYLWMIIKYLIILIGLFFLYKYANGYIPWSILTWSFALIWLVIYCFFVVAFMDFYLDSIVLTSTGLVIFLWDWFFKYEVKNLDWERLDIITGEQVGIMDMIFKKWTLFLQIEENRYRFKNISNPRKQAQMIIETKNSLINKEEHPQELDKFDVFVETLWEVIVDYIKNNKNKPSEDTYFG